MNRTLLLASALLALGTGGPAAALPLISEVLYDAAGSDDGAVFVELYGAAGSSLDGYVLEGVNGADGSVTGSLALSGSFPGDGIFVVADAASGGGSGVADADLLLDFDFQNGPDSIVLRDAVGAVVDAVGYGSFAAGDVFAGEGSPAPDPPAGSSIARVFADQDSDDNAVDFQALDTPTPGEAPVSTVPEPAPGLLLATGLAVFGGCGARLGGKPRGGPEVPAPRRATAPRPPPLPGRR
jgi:hypothetical protein